MEKIAKITEEQLENFKNAYNQDEVFKEITNINEAGAYCIGDTAIKVNNSKRLDVFKVVFNNRNFYYIILNPIDEEMAFAYSLYPRI